MGEVECDHDLYGQADYAAEFDSNDHVGITVRIHCDKCGGRWDSQYSWDFTGDVTDEPERQFECDHCGKEFAENDLHEDDYMATYCSEGCKEACEEYQCEGCGYEGPLHEMVVKDDGLYCDEGCFKEEEE